MNGRFFYSFSFFLCLPLPVYQSSNPVSLTFSLWSNFTHFLHSVPQPLRPEPGLMLAVRGSCSMVDMGIVHIQSLGQLGLVHFPVTGQIIGSIHLFRTTPRNKSQFQPVVYRSFWVWVLGCFFPRFFSGAKNTTHLLASSNKLRPGPHHQQSMFRPKYLQELNS